MVEKSAADLQQELFESRRYAVQLGIERQHLRDRIDGLRDEALGVVRREMGEAIEAAVQKRDRALAERDGLVGARDLAMAERDRAMGERDAARAMLERVMSSTAWRVTGPVRRVLQTLLGR